MGNPVTNFWHNQYSTNLQEHSKQNKLISRDLMRNLDLPTFYAIGKAQVIMEMGCGTGELSCLINQEWPDKNIVGLDLSEEAVRYAVAHYASKNLAFLQYDFVNQPLFGKPDLIVCSNVLEHFRNPHMIIEMFLNHAPWVLILTPFNQPCADGYDGEGGAGHVFTFNEGTYREYYNTGQVRTAFTFVTPGWQHSSRGEEAQQLVVLLRNADL